MGRLGKSYYSPTTGSARRDLYVALGYLKDIRYADYYARFSRHPIGKRVVSAPVGASWRLFPSVHEVVENRTRDSALTPFEVAWNSLQKEKRIFHYLSRSDLLSGIGQFGVLLLGFDDGQDLDTEVRAAANLLYLMPYAQDAIDIYLWDEDLQSERYGKPLVYRITMGGFKGNHSGMTALVHHTRVLHMAEGCLEDDTFGVPRLRACFNCIQDIETVSGGSAEMFWRGALPGLVFSLDSDTDIDSEDLADVNEQMEKYVQGLQRHLRFQGVNVEQLMPTVADPSQHVDVQMQLISAATGIPKRILTGSERGELASSQDEMAWNSLMDERRSHYVEPMILRPFIDRLIDVGVLPSVEEYVIDWPSLYAPSDADKAAAAKVRAEALVAYSSAPGADFVVPPSIFLRDFLGYDDDKIREVEQLLETYIEEEVEDEDEDESDLQPEVK